MRLVASLEKEDLAKRFSLFLQKENIENTLEQVFDKDKNLVTYNIWVHNEDALNNAQSYYRTFLLDPLNKKFDVFIQDVTKNQSDKPKEEISKEEKLKDRSPSFRSDPVAIKKNYPYMLTYFFIILCAVLFFWDLTQGMDLINKYKLKQLILLTPIQKKLLFDRTKERDELDKVIVNYSIKSEKELDNPPKEAQEKIANIKKMPTWKGLYFIILNKFKNYKEKVKIKTPMFNKIKEGQIYRLFTPAILHRGFFHIIVNMLWLLFLGKQIEPRLGFIRYILFIIIAAIISNIAQYLMSGPYFLGFSGVITAMIGYVFVRQKIAPWEGYNVPNIIFYVIGIFIFATLFLQIVIFFFQVFKPQMQYSFGIANTAHIIGAVVGMCLAKIPFFVWRTSE